ncbi:MAG: hypothetical protein ACR2KZ_00050 [Segetibacter sp.]
MAAGRWSNQQQFAIHRQFQLDGNKGDGNALKKISSISTRSAEWSPQLPNRHNEESV